jgi:hypothetical protein
MRKCVTCGNEYDASFDILTGDETYSFNSFECAIAKLAPLCEGRSVKVIGHGLQSGDRYFSSDHCGVSRLEDRS